MWHMRTDSHSAESKVEMACDGLPGSSLRPIHEFRVREQRNTEARRTYGAPFLDINTNYFTVYLEEIRRDLMNEPKREIAIGRFCRTDEIPEKHKEAIEQFFFEKFRAHVEFYACGAPSIESYQRIITRTENPLNYVYCNAASPNWIRSFTELKTHLTVDVHGVVKRLLPMTRTEIPF